MRDISGTVHWVGTGRSTGSGLNLLTERAQHLMVWGRDTTRAEDCLARLGLADHPATRSGDIADLPGMVRDGDVVVSMLPASEHPSLLQLCLDRNAHFACSSYAAEPIVAMATGASAAGLTVLTEAGLDPGIDHLFARRLVAAANATVGDGAIAEFTSYCGGIPAVPNGFRYRFSWAPEGVLKALCAPAKYIEGGRPHVVAEPWKATRPLTLRSETFEVYPNRDSLPYLGEYQIPGSWQVASFVRGTLRLDGWRQAWAGVFAELAVGDEERIARLARRLAAEFPATPADRDRVLLTVALRVRSREGMIWTGEYLLDITGTHEESAMARCVSVPLAFGVSEILAGQTSVGLTKAASDPAAAERWLAALTKHNVPWLFSQHLQNPPRSQ